MDSPVSANPEQPFDVEAELRRQARAIVRSKHRDIPDDVFDALLEEDGSLRDEYEAWLKKMREPVAPDFPRSGIIPNQGVRVFEITCCQEVDADGLKQYGVAHVVVGIHTLEDAPPPPPKAKRLNREGIYKQLLHNLNKRQSGRIH